MTPWEMQVVLLNAGWILTLGCNGQYDVLASHLPTGMSHQIATGSIVSAIQRIYDIHKRYTTGEPPAVDQERSTYSDDAKGG